MGLVPDVTILEKFPEGAVQVPVLALPVNVPTTEIFPFEQTDWVVGETVTPVNELTFIALLPLLGDETLIFPQGFTPCTVTT